MDPRVLMLGWGFPPNVTGGLDTWVGEVFEAFEEKDAELELLLPRSMLPRVVTVSTASRPARATSSHGSAG